MAGTAPVLCSGHAQFIAQKAQQRRLLRYGDDQGFAIQKELDGRFFAHVLTTAITQTAIKLGRLCRRIPGDDDYSCKTRRIQR